MHIDQLRSFRTVVDEGSFTRAARKLHLTQPAISYHIRSLENACGLALLERVGGRMQPTQVGQVVYRSAITIVDEIDAMHGRVASFKDLSGGRLGVGAGVTVGSHTLAPFVAQFHRRFPLVHVDLLIDRSSTVIEQVLAGTIDFGLVIDHAIPDEIFKEHAFRDPIVLIMAPWQPFANRAQEPINVRSLNNVPMVSFSREGITRDIVEHWLTKFGVRPKVELEFDNTTAITRVVSEGIGCAFIMRSAVERELAGGVLKAVEIDSPQLYADYVLIRRPRSDLPPSAHEFLQAFITDLREHHPGLEIDDDVLQRFLGIRSLQLRPA